MSFERGSHRKISRSTTFILTNEEHSALFLIADLALSSLLGAISTSPYLRYDRAVIIYRLKQKVPAKKKGDILQDRYPTFKSALNAVSKEKDNFKKMIIPSILYRGALLYTNKIVSNAWTLTYESYDRYGTEPSLPMLSLLAMIPPMAMSTLMQFALITKVKLANDVSEHSREEYKSFIDCLVKLEKNSGISVFFTGYHLLLASQALSSVCDTLFRKIEMTRESDGDPFLLRAVSDLTKFVITYPIRLVHERMLAEAGLVDALSAMDWFDKIWHENGIKGFFEGFWENFAIEIGIELIEKVILFAKDKLLETSKSVPRPQNIRGKNQKNRRLEDDDDTANVEEEKTE